MHLLSDFHVGLERGPHLQVIWSVSGFMSPDRGPSPATTGDSEGREQEGMRFM